MRDRKFRAGDRVITTSESNPEGWIYWTSEMDGLRGREGEITDYMGYYFDGDDVYRVEIPGERSWCWPASCLFPIDIDECDYDVSDINLADLLDK